FTVEISTAGNFSVTSASSQTVLTTASLTGLLSNTTYYARTKAQNGSGSETGYVRLGSAKTLYSSSDLTPPIITNNVTGDPIWRSSNTTTYNVDFADNNESGLSKFQIRSSTTSNANGPFPTDWVDVASSMNDPYTNDWLLPSNIWESLTEGASNYISILVFDAAGNSSTATAVFIVLKDTTAPTANSTLANVTAIPKTYGYFSADPGAVFDIDFADHGSRLDQIQYSASTSSGSANVNIINWTSITNLAAGTSQYSANWAINFSALADSATNFISVRAWDVAGTTTTLTDAFLVLKDTTTPMTAISSPTDTYRSQLAAISGTAADAVGLQGTEMIIQELSTSKFWSGSAFSEENPKWLKASGVGRWAYDTSGISWSDNISYRLVARSSDVTHLFSSIYATMTFTLDSSQPAVSIATPSNNTTIESLSAISGTANDPGVGAAGLYTITTQLQRSADSLWWDFSAETWTVAATRTLGTGTTSWGYAPSSLLQAYLAHQTTYYLMAAALDQSQPRNQSNYQASVVTFTFSDTAPPAAITAFAASTPTSNAGEVLLSWAATGDNGAAGSLVNGYFKIQYSTFTQEVSWSTSSAQATSAFTALAAGATQSLAVTDLTEGTTHYFVIWTMDSDGNWSLPSTGTPSIVVPWDLAAASGKVTQTNGQGISGIVLEAYAQGTETPAATALTQANGSGNYKLNGLVAGNTYTIKAIWTANGITSSVTKNDVPAGALNLNFNLALNYTLGSLNGTLAVPASIISSLKAKKMTLGTSHLAGRYESLAQDRAQPEEPFVEISANGRLLCRAPVDSSSRYEINNLLPGVYSVTGFNGKVYSQAQKVSVAEGQSAQVTLQWQIVNPDSVFAFPNPANNEMTLRFISNIPSIEARFVIYDIAGNSIRELSGSAIAGSDSGIYRAKWDSANSHGDRVASGVYLFILYVKDTSNGDTEKIVKKMAIIR
ncbi:MAG: T9SS type A sorting domain-containing protein, partial [Elusimicrobia bacterium]|nr:T9SS type A sorting domain-containing protein [Elusimicrobiota bacterium]